MEPRRNERHVINDMDGSLPCAKIKSCSICDPSVLILQEDESIGLFIGETERGKIRRKDMSPMGDKVLLILSTLCSKLLIASM
jgi:cleavage and polyadenylation specificity factor subunit 1